MNHTAQQYACFADAAVRDQGTRFKARLSVTRSWSSRVAPNSYPRSALVCDQFHSPTSFHETMYFDHACSFFLTPNENHAFDPSVGQLSDHFHSRRGRVHQVGVARN